MWCNEQVPTSLGRVSVPTKKSGGGTIFPCRTNWIFSLNRVYIDDMEAMPAVDKLQDILYSNRLSLVMVDTTQCRYVDLYCQKRKNPDHYEGGTNVEDNGDDSESDISNDSRGTGCVCGLCE